MPISRLDHYSIRTMQLEATERFYTDVLGFEAGPRPNFPFPGVWLYQGGIAVVHVVGIPLHWGFMGAARKGFGPNSLTPYVGDANIETPEYKAFLVDIEPITGPVA